MRSIKNTKTDIVGLRHIRSQLEELIIDIGYEMDCHDELYLPMMNELISIQKQLNERVCTEFDLLNKKAEDDAELDGWTVQTMYSRGFSYICVNKNEDAQRVIIEANTIAPVPEGCCIYIYENEDDAIADADEEMDKGEYNSFSYPLCNYKIEEGEFIKPSKDITFYPHSEQELYVIAHPGADIAIEVLNKID